jgi:hypothetical protein
MCNTACAWISLLLLYCVSRETNILAFTLSTHVWKLAGVAARAVQANHMPTSSCRPSPRRSLCLSSRRHSSPRRRSHRRTSRCCLGLRSRGGGRAMLVRRTPHYGRRSSCTRVALASTTASRAATAWLAWHESARVARASRTFRRMGPRVRRGQASGAARLPRTPPAQPPRPPIQPLPSRCGNAAASTTPAPPAGAATSTSTSEAEWLGASRSTPRHERLESCSSRARSSRAAMFLGWQRTLRSRRLQAAAEDAKNGQNRAG